MIAARLHRGDDDIGKIPRMQKIAVLVDFRLTFNR
jgi:hypothetical protein